MTIKISSAKKDKEAAPIKADIDRIKLEISLLERRPAELRIRSSKRVIPTHWSIPRKEIDDLNVALNDKIELLKQLEESFRAPLEAYLKKINGKANTYTMDAEDVISYALETEEDLRERGATLKSLIGATASYRPAGKSRSNAYAKKSSPSITTRINIRRVADGWRLVHASRDECYVNETASEDITVSQAAVDSIIATATRGLVVRAP